MIYLSVQKEVKRAIKNVKKENYKNYFNNAYNKDTYINYVNKDSTLKRTPKIIKINLSIYH